MILDNKFNGILDQGAGNLIVYEQVDKDVTFDTGIQTIKELNVVTDRLYDKARRLTHHN
jgi:26S proteasome regulatory subunit N6